MNSYINLKPVGLTKTTENKSNFWFIIILKSKIYTFEYAQSLPDWPHDFLQMMSKYSGHWAFELEFFYLHVEPGELFHSSLQLSEAI